MSKMMSEKYFFYKQYRDGNVSVAWDLTKSAAKSRHSRANTNPESEAKAWGWHMQNGSLTEQIIRKKAANSWL